jgi:hypothetical protein
MSKDGESPKDDCAELSVSDKVGSPGEIHNQEDPIVSFTDAFTMKNGLTSLGKDGTNIGETYNRVVAQPLSIALGGHAIKASRGAAKMGRKLRDFSNALSAPYAHTHDLLAERMIDIATTSQRDAEALFIAWSARVDLSRDDSDSIDSGDDTPTIEDARNWQSGENRERRRKRRELALARLIGDEIDKRFAELGIEPLQQQPRILPQPKEKVDSNNRDDPSEKLPRRIKKATKKKRVIDASSIKNIQTPGQWGLSVAQSRWRKEMSANQPGSGKKKNKPKNGAGSKKTSSRSSNSHGNNPNTPQTPTPRGSNHGKPKKIPRKGIKRVDN